jgi:transposase
MIKSLPKEEKKELDSAFKSSKNKKEANRIQIVRLLSKGYSHGEVTKITGMSEGSIRKMVELYNRKGIQGLRLKEHPRNNSRLTIRQKDKIKKILHQKEIPSEAGIKVPEDEDFWSTATLRSLVKKKFRVEYKTKRSYQRLFKYCGLTYQKVEFEDERRSNEEGEDFKKRFQMKLKKGAISMWW